VKTTGAGVLAGRRVAAYPNPAGDRLHVEAPAGAAVELFDGSGRLRLRRRQANDRESLDVRFLPPGLYLVRVRTEYGVWSGKVVVH
jgi:hypothetical protein